MTERVTFILKYWWMKKVGSSKKGAFLIQGKRAGAWAPLGLYLGTCLKRDQHIGPLLSSSKRLSAKSRGQEQRLYASTRQTGGGSRAGCRTSFTLAHRKRRWTDSQPWAHLFSSHRFFQDFFLLEKNTGQERENGPGGGTDLQHMALRRLGRESGKQLFIMISPNRCC